MATQLSDCVLVTGATGLIGSWVVRQWPTPGPALVPVGSSDIDLLQPGAAAGLVADVAPTHVVHLAWSASGHPGYRNSSENDRWLRATLELAAAARESGARLWLTGTIVDAAAPGPPGTVDAYSASKIELRRTFAADIDGKVVGLLRPSYVVDEVLGRPALVAQARAAARAGEPVSLRSPAARHDFIHAADVGAAVVVAVENDLRGELDIGAGRLRAVTDLVAALGARWVAESVETGAVAHSDGVSDVEWLTARGWRPTRTDELFGRSS